jgi:type IV pilus assembly protein PilW
LTLIELLISTAISLVIITAAGYVYLSSRDTQRTLSDKAMAFENAKFAIDTITRNLENAGFYPAEYSNSSTDNAVNIVGYANPVTASPPTAYNAGVFGCQKQRLGSNLTCTNHSSSTEDADGLVINYYIKDKFGDSEGKNLNLDTGNRSDCLRQDAENDPINIAAGKDKPTFVSNRYTLTSADMKIEGTTVNTFNLSCWGNGNTQYAYQPMVVGFEQLRFTYLLDNTATAQYVSANAIAADQWASVRAVRICLMARSLQPVRLQGSKAYALTDCDGSSQNFSDGVDRQVFTQVVALKNQLTQSF